MTSRTPSEVDTSRHDDQEQHADILQWLRGERALVLPSSAEFMTGETRPQRQPHHNLGALNENNPPPARPTGTTVIHHRHAAPDQSQPASGRLPAVAEDGPSPTRTSMDALSSLMDPFQIDQAQRVHVDEEVGLGTETEETEVTSSSCHRGPILLLLAYMLQNTALLLTVGHLYQRTAEPYFHIHNFPYYELYSLIPFVLVSTTVQLVFSIVLELTRLLIATRRRLDGDSGHNDYWASCCSRQALFMIVPAVLHILQCAMLRVTLDNNLTSSLYHVTFQLKLVVAAWLSVKLLRPRHYTKWQWVAMVLISFGVARLGGNNPLDNLEEKLESMVTAFVAGVCSALSSVYLEKVLKVDLAAAATTSTEPSHLGDRRSAPSHLGDRRFTPSLWMRNLQLSLFTIILLLLQHVWVTWRTQASYFADLQDFVSLYGGSPEAWFLIVLNAGGGILLTMVLQRTDTVQKELAQAVSAIFVALGACWLLNMKLRKRFYFGSLLVVFGLGLFRRYRWMQALWRKVLKELKRE